MPYAESEIGKTVKVEEAPPEVPTPSLWMLVFIGAVGALAIGAAAHAATRGET